MRTPGEQQPADEGDEEGGDAGDGAGRLLAGRYRVTGRLGRGGMGVVWRAVDEVLGREVALKELRTYTDSGSAELDDLRTRMQREARAAARVRHPGVIAVHDVTQHEGRPVIVMELVEGPSLDDVLRERGTLEPREAAAIGAKVLDALAAAHRAGVLHRDVKPGNVLLESGGERVVLTDFGIAAMEDPDDGASTHLTGSGQLVGSLDYLAPERARGERPGPASDVWALGATLYAAVEGAAPFRRTSTWSTLNAIVVDPLPEPRRAGPLAPALAELMVKDPRMRADAARAAELLGAVAAGTAPPPASDTVRLGKPAGPPGPPGGPGAPAQHLPQPPHDPAVRGAALPSAGAAPPGSYGPPSAGPYDPGPGQQPGAQDGFDGRPAPSGASGPYRTDSDRQTLPAGETRLRARRRAVIAAAVAAVLLTGAGVTYAVMAGGGGDGDGASASHYPATDKASGSDGRGAGNAADGKPGGRHASPSGSAFAGHEPGAAAGGASDDGHGKGGHSADGGTGSDSGRASDSGGGAGSSGGGGSDDKGAAAGGAGGGQPAPAPACHGTGGGKYECAVWKTATSYNGAHKPVGQLNAGTNYFFCQTKLSQRETSGRWTNIWWAKTDDDNGHTGVFVSDVYIRGGDNDQPLPGLPTC